MVAGYLKVCPLRKCGFMTVKKDQKQKWGTGSRELSVPIEAQRRVKSVNGFFTVIVATILIKFLFPCCLCPSEANACFYEGCH